MKLWRVVFYDKTSDEHYNHWHTCERGAETAAQKLIKDGITDKTVVDFQELINNNENSGRSDRVTLPIAVNFLNRHAVVNIDMGYKFNDMEIENDSMGG